MRGWTDPNGPQCHPPHLQHTAIGDRHGVVVACGEGFYAASCASRIRPFWTCSLDTSQRGYGVAERERSEVSGHLNWWGSFELGVDQHLVDALRCSNYCEMLQSFQIKLSSSSNCGIVGIGTSSSLLSIDCKGWLP